MRSLSWLPIVSALAPAMLACSAANKDSASNTAAQSDAGGTDAPPDAVDPTLNPDPQDLDPVSGDRALDVASSQIFFDNGAPWVRVTFYGAWPPSAQLSSWGCSVLLGTENTPVVTYTRLGSDGKESDQVDGIDAAKITYEKEPMGFRVRVGDTTVVFDRYAIESNVEKTAGGSQVEDSSGAFVVTTRNQRPFGG